MKQKDKELLFKDICGRFPYGVKLFAKYVDGIDAKESKGRLALIDDDLVIAFIDEDNNSFTHVALHEIKPYLFPLSSMTEEQKYDFYCRFIENEIDFDNFKEFYFENNEWHKMLTLIDDIEEIIDWFNKYHFDFRCLIPKGLAIDATDKNIY